MYKNIALWNMEWWLYI